MHSVKIMKILKITAFLAFFTIACSKESVKEDIPPLDTAQVEPEKLPETEKPETEKPETEKRVIFEIVKVTPPKKDPPKPETTAPAEISLDDVLEIVHSKKAGRLSLKQIKEITSKGFENLCRENTSNALSVYQTKNLTPQELKPFKDCLTVHQIRNLSKETLLELGIFTDYTGKFSLTPTQLKNMGDQTILKLDCDDFKQMTPQHIKMLTPQQVNLAKEDRSKSGNELDATGEWCWAPEQWAMFSKEQIQGLTFGFNTFLSAEDLKNISDDQLRSFSKEQVRTMNKWMTHNFSPQQLDVLRKQGTLNDFMKEALRYHNQGDGVFDQYGYELPVSLEEYFIYCLKPSQFSSIRAEQILHLPFETVLELSPKQIAHFPNFVSALNFKEDYIEKIEIQKYDWDREKSSEKLENQVGKYSLAKSEESHYLYLYETLNHVKLLKLEQIQAIAPDQIPYIPAETLELIYKRDYTFNNGHYSKNNYKERQRIYREDLEREVYITSDNNIFQPPLTQEQFMNMSEKQFLHLFKDNPEEFDYVPPQLLKQLTRKSASEFRSLTSPPTS